VTTIADVARHAGVSTSTVSYVLSGKRTISAGTRSRVLASVRALGYHPHAGARALATHRAGVLGLALPLRTVSSQPAVLQFADGVVAAARAAGLDVLLLPADEGPAALQHLADSALIDGLIALLPAAADPATRPHSPEAGRAGPDSPGSDSPEPHSPGPHSPGPHSPGPHSPGPHSAGPQSPGPHASARDGPQPDSVEPRTIGLGAAGPCAPALRPAESGAHSEPEAVGLPRVLVGLPGSAECALDEGRRAVGLLLERLGASPPHVQIDARRLN
jgi:hypothetical protein